MAKDKRGDIEAGFVAQARFKTTHGPTAGFSRRNGDRREAQRRVAVEDLMSIMDEAAQRRMAGCDGAASQTSREELEYPPLNVLNFVAPLSKLCELYVAPNRRGCSPAYWYQLTHPLVFLV